MNDLQRSPGERPLPNPGTLQRILREQYGLPASHELLRRVATWGRTGNPQLERHIRRALSQLRGRRDALRYVGDKIPPPDLLETGIPLFAVPSPDKGSSIIVMFDPTRLTLHTIVVGLPGSGKSTSVKRLLRLLAKHCPWVRIIVLDPNSSYADTCSGPDWLSLTLSDLQLAPFCPPEGYSLETWVRESLETLTLQELKHSRYLIEHRLTWLFDLARRGSASGEPFRYPSLVDLRDNLEANKERPGSPLERYRETALNVLNGRVGACRSLYDCSEGMEPLVTDTRVRLALEGIGGLSDLEFLFSHVMHYVAARRSMAPLLMPPPLHTLMVLEEAQVLLQPRAEGISYYQGMLLRLRALGVGVLLVTQDLSRVDPLIVAACSNFFVFSQSTRDNKRVVRATLDLSSGETDLLGELPPGCCFVRMAGHKEWPHPFLGEIPLED